MLHTKHFKHKYIDTYRKTTTAVYSYCLVLYIHSLQSSRGQNSWAGEKDGVIERQEDGKRKWTGRKTKRGRKNADSGLRPRADKKTKKRRETQREEEEEGGR